MSKMSHVKKSIITAVCIALCTVLPLAFHAIPNAGIIISPMHIPVLLCGLIAGAPWGFLCGILGPVISSLITGMPVVAYLPRMMIELATYGLISGLCMQLIHTKRLYLDLYISLIISLLAGRIVAGVAKAVIFTPGNYSLKAWVTSYFITLLPGLIIQLVFIPTICFALEKAKLIPARYPTKQL